MVRGERLRCSICHRTQKIEGLLSHGLFGDFSLRHPEALVRMQHVPLFFRFDTAHPQVLKTLRRIWEDADEELRTLLLRLWPGPSAALDAEMRDHLRDHLRVFPFVDLDSFDSNPRLRNKSARRLLRETLARRMAKGMSETLRLHMRATREVSPQEFSETQKNDLRNLFPGTPCPLCWYKGEGPHECGISFHEFYGQSQAEAFGLLHWDAIYTKPSLQAPGAIGGRRGPADLLGGGPAPPRRKRRRLA